MNNGKKLLVINALHRDAYNDCHIKGSIGVPLNELESFAKTVDKLTPIVVYCASYICPVSRAAWQKLDALGFKNLWAYEGGMHEWYHAGLPVVGACKSDYLQQEIDEPEKHTSEVTEISAQELKKMMKENGLL